MRTESQFNCLAALFAVLGCVLVFAQHTAEGMAFLSAATAFTGRGKTRRE